jgi:hypothetical protein
MKNPLWLIVLGVFSLTSLLVGCDTNKITFSCDKNSNDEWTTFVKNGKETHELIIWERTEHTKRGFPPERRCQEVTPKLQEAQDNGSLPSLTHGETWNEKEKKDIPVLCTSDEKKEKCKTLILTLYFNDDPKDQLKKFTEVLNGDSPQEPFKIDSCKLINDRLHCSVDINNVFNKKK